MKRGTASLDLEFDFEFDGAGEPTLMGVRYGEVELPEKLAERLWQAMGREQAEAMVDEAWEDSTDVDDDDAASDEARMPRSA